MARAFLPAVSRLTQTPRRRSATSPSTGAGRPGPCADGEPGLRRASGDCRHRREPGRGLAQASGGPPGHGVRRGPGSAGCDRGHDRNRAARRQRGFLAFGKAAAQAPGFDPSNVGRRCACRSPRIPIMMRARLLFSGWSRRSAVFLESYRRAPPSTPFSPGGYFTSVIVDGRPTPDGEPRTVQFRRADPGYFKTMKIAELRGRTFAPSDTATSQPVVVISQQMARILAGRGRHRPASARGSAATNWFTVIGVVDDVRDRGPANRSSHFLRAVFAEHESSGAHQSGRADRRRPRRVSAGHHPGPAPRGSHPCHCRGSPRLRSTSGVARRGRFRSVLLLVFAAVGLLLAVVGIYGVTSRGSASARANWAFALPSAAAAASYGGSCCDSRSLPSCRHWPGDPSLDCRGVYVSMGERIALSDLGWRCPRCCCWCLRAVSPPRCQRGAPCASIRSRRSGPSRTTNRNGGMGRIARRSLIHPSGNRGSRACLPGPAQGTEVSGPWGP